MALQGSGSISLSDIASEFDVSAPYSLSDFYRGGGNVPDSTANSGVPTSGSISLTDFYGADAQLGEFDPAGPLAKNNASLGVTYQSAAVTCNITGGPIDIVMSGHASAKQQKNGSGAYTASTLSYADGDTIRLECTAPASAFSSNTARATYQDATGNQLQFAVNT